MFERSRETTSTPCSEKTLFRFIPYFVSCYPTTYTKESLGGSESGWRRSWWRQRQRRDPWRKRRGVGPHQTMDRQTGRLASWLAGINIVFLKLHLRNVNIHVYLSLQLWSVPGRGNMARGLVVPNCWRQLDLHSLGNWATVKAKSTHFKTLHGKSCKICIDRRNSVQFRQSYGVSSHFNIQINFINYIWNAVEIQFGCE